VYALPGALDAVMALDRPETLAGALDLTELSPGGQLGIGPFRAQTHLLPHWVPNVGLRLAAGEAVLAYTGDCGPSPLIAELARQADLLLAEASYVDLVPEDSRRHLSSASQAGRRAAQAGAGRLLLTHLLPGTDPAAAQDAAASHYTGHIGVAASGLVLDLP
jgi:ribonuclease BN (tRNA processing enzyme)